MSRDQRGESALNVLLITADQWRGDCLGCLGHPCLRTPHLDALAADGVLFRNHFSQATPCGPARASLLTGMYAMNHRSVANGTPLDARHGNLALEARRAGYRPRLFGYTDTSADPRGLPPDDPRLFTYEGVMPGFEVEVHLPEHGGAWLDNLGAATGERPELAGLYGVRLGEPASFPAERSETAFLTDAVLDFLRRHDDSPWFIHLTYIKPHAPLVAAAPYHALYDPADVPPPVRAASPEVEARQHPWLARALARPFGGDWAITVPGGPELLDEATVRRLRAVYCGLITEVDHHIGRLLNTLKARGEFERTLIVVTSDHGEMLGDHWLLGKAGYFPQAFHVPLIVRDPRQPAAGRGRVVDAFTEHVDLMPTILTWLGLEPPLQCDGRSLLPRLAGDAPADWRAAAHYEYDFRDTGIGAELGLPWDLCALSVRHGARYSYVHFTALPALCFDRAADPHQLRSIAGDPVAAPVVLEQAQAMLSWRMAFAERRLTGCLLTPEGPVGRF